MNSNLQEDGPFVLRSLFANVPLSADGSSDDIKINCVEFLGMHIYDIYALPLYHIP